MEEKSKGPSRYVAKLLILGGVVSTLSGVIVFQEQIRNLISPPVKITAHGSVQKIKLPDVGLSELKQLEDRIRKTERYEEAVEKFKRSPRTLNDAWELGRARERAEMAQMISQQHTFYAARVLPELRTQVRLQIENSGRKELSGIKVRFDTPLLYAIEPADSVAGAMIGRASIPIDTLREGDATTVTVWSNLPASDLLKELRVDYPDGGVEIAYPVVAYGLAGRVAADVDLYFLAVILMLASLGFIIWIYHGKMAEAMVIIEEHEKNARLRRKESASTV
ncbi:MAG TPA: hypothetical protein VF615_26890 [Longimicrobiaceae bacterium]|jgi:hypothetical protein